mmetsp:Transcript_35869/g.85094  ORF Transcript_35869/g.85094 Transcript_35869/m.85094 type:complete len:480 (-) Transcript_35869:590-2029(-)
MHPCLLLLLLFLLLLLCQPSLSLSLCSCSCVSCSLCSCFCSLSSCSCSSCSSCSLCPPSALCSRDHARVPNRRKTPLYLFHLCVLLLHQYQRRALPTVRSLLSGMHDQAKRHRRGLPCHRLRDTLARQLRHRGGHERPDGEKQRTVVHVPTLHHDHHLPRPIRYLLVDCEHVVGSARLLLARYRRADPLFCTSEVLLALNQQACDVDVARVGVLPLEVPGHESKEELIAVLDVVSVGEERARVEEGLRELWVKERMKRTPSHLPPVHCYRQLEFADRCCGVAHNILLTPLLLIRQQARARSSAAFVSDLRDVDRSSVCDGDARARDSMDLADILRAFSQLDPHLPSAMHRVADAWLAAETFAHDRHHGLRAGDAALESLPERHRLGGDLFDCRIGGGLLEQACQKRSCCPFRRRRGQIDRRFQGWCGGHVDQRGGRLCACELRQLSERLAGGATVSAIATMTWRSPILLSWVLGTAIST